MNWMKERKIFHQIMAGGNSMNGVTYLLEFKNKLKVFYAEYSFAIHMVCKFVVAFAVFLTINRVMGYMNLLNSIYPVLLFALISCLLSVKTTVLFSALMILGHSFALGLEVLAITGVVLLLVFILFLRFDEKESLALLLTPLGIAVGIPCFVPICFGLKGKTSSAVSVACGSIIYSYVQILVDKAPVLQNAEAEDMLLNLQILIDGILQNKQMLLNALVLAIVVIAVSLLRRLPVDYSWHVAIGVGALIYLVATLLGSMYLDTNIQIGAVIIGALISVVLALIVELFMFNVDYSRTERMEFEDDEYYYYVKAVPKMSISEAKRETKTITTEKEVEVEETEVVETEAAEMEVEEVDAAEGDDEEEDIDMMPVEVIPDVAKKLEDSLNDL